VRTLRGVSLAGSLLAAALASALLAGPSLAAPADDRIQKGVSSGLRAAALGSDTTIHVPHVAG